MESANMHINYLAISKAGTHAPGRYPPMPRNSFAKMQSCTLKRPSIILIHCFCTYAFTCETSRELNRILMERSRI